jgi:hypothetical protein
MVYFVHLLAMHPVDRSAAPARSAALDIVSRHRRDGLPAEPPPLTTWTTPPPASLLELVPAAAALPAIPALGSPLGGPPAVPALGSPPGGPPAVASALAAPASTASAEAGARQHGEATWLKTIPTGTCANNAAPIGATITVTDSSSGMTVACVVVSRGPYGPGRIVDLAEATFAALAPPSQGVVSVRVSW